jgi:integrase
VIRLLPIPPPSVPFHDVEQFERLVDAASKRGADAHLIVLRGGEAGRRRGEIAALTWGDVNLKKRRLCVQRSVWQGHTEAPKGGRLRYVPLTLRLTAALQAARHLRGPLVFCDAAGKPVSENVIAHHVEHASRAAQLTRRGVHVMRHGRRGQSPAPYGEDRCFYRRAGLQSRRQVSFNRPVACSP